MGDGTIEVVECCEYHVDVQVIQNLVLWLEGCGVHDCQRIVHDLLRVERDPQPQHHPQLLLLGVQGACQHVRLRPVGEGWQRELLVEFLPLSVVLVVVEVRPEGPRLVSRLVTSPHQVGQPLNPLTTSIIVKKTIIFTPLVCG